MKVFEIKKKCLALIVVMSEYSDNYIQFSYKLE